MTETTCPTCGAKCIESVKKAYISALPQPDLNKLREIHSNWKYLLVLCDGTSELRIGFLSLMEAVKEVLDEQVDEGRA